MKNVKGKKNKGKVSNVKKLQKLYTSFNPRMR